MNYPEPYGLECHEGWIEMDETHISLFSTVEAIQALRDER